MQTSKLTHATTWPKSVCHFETFSAEQASKKRSASTCHIVVSSSEQSPRRESTKSQGDQEDVVCLVSFGYSLKDSVAERRTALEAAVKARGVPAVISRLEFLLQAWSGTQKFVDAIGKDVRYLHSLESDVEYQFMAEGI